MALTTDNILHGIMEKATDGLSNTSEFKRFHVSQTADQLPDIKIRNAWYKSELEKQIQEKREKERKERDMELLDEERLLRKIECEREKLRREYLEEVDRRTQAVNGTPQHRIYTKPESPTQDEARRKQQAIAKRMEEIQLAETKRRDEEAEKKKRLLLESLYYKDFREPKSTYSSYFFRRPWNSRDYVHSALRVSLEEIYTAAPLHQLADVYRKLEIEKLKLREIIRQRIAEGEEE